jgi:hypothetical protein
MAIILPFPLTAQEIRVLQEFRRIGAESLTADAIRSIKHPTGGGEAPAGALVSKGYLQTAGDGSYSVTEKGREFLAIDVRPEGEEAGTGSEEAVE